MLADGDAVVLIDCEVAHWADPRFDLAFCLSHLSLMAMRGGTDSGRLAEAAHAVLTACREEGLPMVDAAPVRFLGGLALARLEGDSPVDYLAELDNAAAKRAAAAMVEDPSRDPGFIVRSIRGPHL